MRPPKVVVSFIAYFSGFQPVGGGAAPSRKVLQNQLGHCLGSRALSYPPLGASKIVEPVYALSDPVSTRENWAKMPLWKHRGFLFCTCLVLQPCQFGIEINGPNQNKMWKFTIKGEIHRCLIVSRRSSLCCLCDD